MKGSEKLRHCAGCHDNYYNQAGNSEAGRCWAFENAKLIQRKEVHIDQRPPWTQKARLFLDCYYRPRYVYVAPDRKF